MWKFLIGIYLQLLIPNASIAQNVNLIIQINGKLVEAGEISNLYISSKKEKPTDKIEIDYYPGDLILNEKAWMMIKSDSLNKFSIHFNFNTFTKKDHVSKTFNFEVNSYLLKRPYLLLNIYDFQDKKYKKWYQYLTKDNYLAELKFPNSGVYIRKE